MFSTIMWWITGQVWDGWRFSAHLLIMILLALVSHSLGLLVSAIFINNIRASLLSFTIFVTPLLLLSGALIPIRFGVNMYHMEECLEGADSLENVTRNSLSALNRLVAKQNPSRVLECSDEVITMTPIRHTIPTTDDRLKLYWNGLTYKTSDNKKLISRNKTNVKTIINDLNGEITSGQLTGILGPSGSGKTTLIECLAGKRVAGLSGRVWVKSTNDK
ncbi:unnamed protein product [Oppiella nova]|uniref:ABC transporter domain-containing protein n=1 Tax=Oppiella nova TaxID=334625 RepID=A0A7R9MJX5_9ACAR|nr:unnamed protein product [Oppiella nova]CAG2177777.1 unnamed protein product [Oppiella nova]